MHRFKKIVILFLTLSLLCAFAFEGVALDKDTFKTNIHRSFWNTLEGVVDHLVTAVASIFPTPESWNRAADTAAACFYPGTTFLKAPAPDAAFSMGYAERSLIEDPEDVLGKLYVGGSIDFKDKLASAIFDDLLVRAAAISDGSGRGTALFLVVDAFGLSAPDVQEIRARIAAALPKTVFNSIMVSVLHQHSAVDTFGMNGNIFDIALGNPWRTLLHLKTVNGKNNAYMEHLFRQCADAAVSAVHTMTPGKLFYGTADQTPFLFDKRAPIVNDPNFNRFRFVPDDGSSETWLISSEIHCVGNGAGQTEITGDYPYYASQYIREHAGANAMFFLGAEQSTSQNRSIETIENWREEWSRREEIEGFGTAIAKTLIAISNEAPVSPLLNIRYRTTVLPVSNPILYLAAKVGMINADVVKTEKGVGVRTEIGYIELGDHLAFAVVPGELEAALAYGGVLNGKDAWHGTDWPYPSMQEMLQNAGIDRKLMVIGLANDQIGYIVPDNNYIPMIAEESGSIEFVSLGSHTAGTLMNSFYEILQELD